MQRQIRVIMATALLALGPSQLFASGSAPARPAAHESLTRRNSNQTQATATTNTQTAVLQEPYDLGKALFGGKYTLGHPKLKADNVAEKKLRLVTLQKYLPAAERSRVDAAELSRRLTNREMNALEYYLGMRFGKFITKAPSWAKDEPPPKVAYSR